MTKHTDSYIEQANKLLYIRQTDKTISNNIDSLAHAADANRYVGNIVIGSGMLYVILNTENRFVPKNAAYNILGALVCGENPLNTVETRDRPNQYELFHIGTIDRFLVTYNPSYAFGGMQFEWADDINDRAIAHESDEDKKVVSDLFPLLERALLVAQAGGWYTDGPRPAIKHGFMRGWRCSLTDVTYWNGEAADPKAAVRLEVEVRMSIIARDKKNVSEFTSETWERIKRSGKTEANFAIPAGFEDALRELYIAADGDWSTIGERLHEHV